MATRLPREKHSWRLCCICCSISSREWRDCIPFCVVISMWRTGHPLGSLMALLMVRCLLFHASDIIMRQISCWDMVSSRVFAIDKRHLRCFMRSAGAFCLSWYISFRHAASLASMSCLARLRGFSICSCSAAQRRFLVSGLCRRAIVISISEWSVFWAIDQLLDWTLWSHLENANKHFQRFACSLQVLCPTCCVQLNIGSLQ